MKQLTCEMCGSTNLVKQDGIFVCQSCGCKYSVEEAKKMMIEGTVDVSGSTVKVDNSDALENLYLLARRAKANNNYAEAQKYYGEILKQNPNSWEANFGVIYYAAANCKIGQIESAAKSVERNLKNIFLLIDAYEIPEKKNDARVEVFVRVLALAKGFEESASESHKSLSRGMTISSNSYIQIASDFQKRLGACMTLLMALGECFNALYNQTGNNDDCQRCLIALKQGINCYSRLYQESLYKANPSFYTDTKKVLAIPKELVTKFEPGYKTPLDNLTPPKQNNLTSSKQSGCYVATAVYGSYDCPQVWTLRRYRDYVLAETSYGRAFIHTYYAVSPTLVKWFGNTRWFKKLWKGKLDRLVAKLQHNGFEDTPYKDKQW